MITRKIVFLLFMMYSMTAFAWPDAKITVKVVDESGQPLEGAKVGIGFRKPGGSGWGNLVSSNEKGLTDAEGLFTARGATEPFVGIGASKEGYYRTSMEYSFNYKQSGIPGFRKWEPWNPTVELVLKEIRKPIPLYAVDLQSVEVPEFGKFVGFDLMAGDWVVPYGLGSRKDFLIKLEGEFTPDPFYVNQVLTLKFSNPDDGIQSFFDEPNEGSALRLPHHAPVEGYLAELVLRDKSDSKNIYLNHKRDDQNYFFRIRTKIDQEGNIKSALYGKIHGNISYAIGDLRDPHRRSLNFTYYLNPNPLDTNLEFDIKNNLFTDLEQSEKIGLTP